MCSSAQSASHHVVLELLLHVHTFLAAPPVKSPLVALWGQTLSLDRQWGEWMQVGAADKEAQRKERGLNLQCKPPSCDSR